MGWMVNPTPLPLYPRGKRPATHYIGSWVGPWADNNNNNNNIYLLRLGCYPVTVVILYVNKT